MACTRYRLISLLGTGLLLFSLQACSGPFLAPRVDVSPGEQASRASGAAWRAARRKPAGQDARRWPDLPRGEGPASTADEQRPHPAAPPAAAPAGGEGGERERRGVSPPGRSPGREPDR